VPTYIYELRHDDEVTSTGRLLLDLDVQVGETVHVAGTTAIVEDIAWLSGDDFPRLLLRPSE
jgi:hypothetical protein